MANVHNWRRRLTTKTQNLNFRNSTMHHQLQTDPRCKNIHRSTINGVCTHQWRRSSRCCTYVRGMEGWERRDMAGVSLHNTCKVHDFLGQWESFCILFLSREQINTWEEVCFGCQHTKARSCTLLQEQTRKPSKCNNSNRNRCKSEHTWRRRHPATIFAR